MRILIVGNGGREHALLWKLRRDAPSAEFYATTPNGGMAPGCEAVDIAPGDVEALSGWAAAHRIDLTVVGPEGPLAAGIVDHFEDKGLPIFGPSKNAARIEASKAYSKELMRKSGVPTAEHRTFTSQEGAEAYVRDRGAPIVVKASGLAAGKGAVVCMTEEEAFAAIGSMLGDLQFGEAGRQVVIEEYMEGEELSVFAITDGENCVLLVPSQDHKRVGEGDTGPNTGGMGAYAPVTLATDKVAADALTTVFKPTLDALSDDDSLFKGLLYAGLMLTSDGLKVIEFNCRFGDPECQPLMARLKSDALEILLACAEGWLDEIELEWHKDAALTVVLAAEGYPGAYMTGSEIRGLEAATEEGVLVFHAGTKESDGKIIANGGRVLGVTARAKTIKAAQKLAYKGVDAIDWPQGFCRRDIGWRAIKY